MGTGTDHDGLDAPSDDTSTGDGRGRPLVVDALIRRATERDVAAEERDARAHAIGAALEVDPTAHTAIEVATLAAADRSAAAADRESAADDREMLVRLVLGERPREDGVAPPGLTGREAQVLDRLARAMTTRAIAEDLYLSPNSVKTHTQSVYRKIGVKSRAEAALWARDHGIG
jgi:DNA-binding NarL/FixJ family response regulator